MEVPGFDLFRDLLNPDPYFFAIMTTIQAGEWTYFLLHNGFLFRGNQFCVLDYSLHLWIIKELHGEGHVGKDFTLQLIHDSYFWLTIHKEVVRFVERCRIC